MKGANATRGASLPSFVIVLRYIRGFMPEAVGMEVGKEPKSNQADALQDIIFLHHPTQFETVGYLFL
jgi:hypothetical protein